LKTIGITGGIGSGKSYVCQLLQAQGIPVFESDSVAKAQMAHNELIRNELITAFGPLTYTPERELNRSYLSQLVFSNPLSLQRLNSIVHPCVQNAFEEWCHQHRLSGKHNFVVKEAAILIESNTYIGLDILALVYCPRSIRFNRVQKRSLMEPQALEARMNQQWTDIRKTPHVDFVFYNDGYFDVPVQIAQFLNFIHSK
jgi:dephospho-CoA kinase